MEKHAAPLTVRSWATAFAQKAWAPICIGPALVGCSGVTYPSAPIEPFDATDRFSRTVASGPDGSCEASRLALLSQGYLVTRTHSLELHARKSFQPSNISHVEVEFRVTCVAAPSEDAVLSIVFVSAVQERYELKKSRNAASVGLPALGTISLPFSTGTDSMVKVSSETVTSTGLYDRFFDVMRRFLDIPHRLSDQQDQAADMEPRR